MFGFPKVPSVKVEDLKKSIYEGENFALLDVRTPQEFARGKIAGSVNIPIDEVKAEVAKIFPEKDKTIYVYCLSGSRSLYAVDAMMKMGYTRVYNVQNGFLAWRSKRYPVSS